MTCLPPGASSFTGIQDGCPQWSPRRVFPPAHPGHWSPATPFRGVLGGRALELRPSSPAQRHVPLPRQGARGWPARGDKDHGAWRPAHACAGDRAYGVVQVIRLVARWAGSPEHQQVGAVGPVEQHPRRRPVGEFSDDALSRQLPGSRAFGRGEEHRSFRISVGHGARWSIRCTPQAVLVVSEHQVQDRVPQPRLPDSPAQCGVRRRCTVHACHDPPRGPRLCHRSATPAPETPSALRSPRRKGETKRRPAGRKRAASGSPRTHHPPRGENPERTYPQWPGRNHRWPARRWRKAAGTVARNVQAGPAPGRPGRHVQERSNRSRFITLSHAATKSLTNFSFASSLA